MSIWSDSLADLRRAGRGLVRTPAFTLTAVATLALGIGAASAMFSVVDAVLLRPLPYAKPESRVVLWSRWEGFDKTWLSEAEVLDYAKLPSVEQVAAWSGGQANLTGDGEASRVGRAAVTANLFDTLGSPLLLGRGFTPEEDREGGEAVVVLSHGLWRRAFGGDPGILGRSVQVDSIPRRVVGVAAPGFRLPTDFSVDAAEPSELWIPLRMNTANPERGNHGLYAAASLRPGRSVSGLNAELRALTARLTREGLYPEPMRFTALAVPVAEEVQGGVRPALLLLTGAVGCLLLIACANVANLLLARAEARQREIAVRSALGASQWRIARQLLAEGLVLALPSGALGLALGQAGVRLLLASGAEGVPRANGAGLDLRVLGATALVAIVSTLLFSLAPALRVLRLNLNDSLRDGAHASAGGRRQRLRGALVVGEVAVSVVLLVGAGLLLRSLHALQSLELGFEPRGALTARVALPQADYAEAPARLALYGRLLDAVRALPGVAHAGFMRSLPLGAQIGDWGLMVEGYAPPSGHHAKGDWQVASDGALAALGERIARGRDFSAADGPDAPLVALVNETFARTYWPGQDPLGRRIRMDAPWLTVVGVVADVRHNGVLAPIKEKFYVPQAQFQRSTGNTPRSMTLVVRSSGDLKALVTPIRAILRGLDPKLPLAGVRPLSEVVAEALRTQRLAGMLLGLFAALALLLAAVGLYGVLAYLVGLRTQEVGIRMALGADASQVLRLVLGGAMRLSLVGTGLGLLGAFGLARLLGSLLHEVRPYDPATYAAVAAALLLVALAASYLPARKATRIDPLRALRAE
jgi:putative ABC transport system permease protein